MLLGLGWDRNVPSKFVVSYWAGKDPLALESDDARRTVEQTADVLFHHLQSELEGRSDFRVIAVAGPPGGRGTFVAVHYRLTRDGWGAAEAGSRRPISVIPQFALPRRDEELEDRSAAVGTALAERLDAGDSSAAWDDASPALKAFASREQWERVNAVLTPLRGRADARRAFEWRYGVQQAGAARPGSTVFVRYETSGDRGDSRDDYVEEIFVRLDDDGIWRAAGYRASGLAPLASGRRIP